MLFYDFEVFKYDWLCVIADSVTHEEHVIINDSDGLRTIYDSNRGNIWVGFNSKHYDQWILKAILCGFNPKEINDYIIVDSGEGWRFSNALRDYSIINYDVMPNPPVGLKTLEGFLGSNIKETSVPFDVDRKLTDEEIEQTVFYCRHDVEQTVQVFVECAADFNAMYGIVKAFGLPLACIGMSDAQITARVLECVKNRFHDEFDYYYLPCLKIEKYSHVIDWFDERKAEAAAADLEHATDGQKYAWYKKNKGFSAEVAGIPHVFGFGGIHGAPDEPVHVRGLILHVDVGSYYPSILIGWDLVTRAARKPEQYKNIYDTRMELKRQGKKKEQAPYKLMLNALSGAMKDQNNPAYDPRNNNCMCVNGQLMLLDLIEHLEAVPGFELIQSNTDGLIIRIPDTDGAFDQVDDICYDWESRCSTEKCAITLSLDAIAEIWQKDVNNYLWIDADGKVERKGAYVKELSSIDNDLPILNRALVEYMVHGISVEETIWNCDQLLDFQKIVKLSDKYKWVELEYGTPDVITTGVRVKRTECKYKRSRRYDMKSYRVFASIRLDHGRLLKCGGSRGKPEKFANTPDHCFIFNDSVDGVPVPDDLDRAWYVQMAKRRLKHFGIS